MQDLRRAAETNPDYPPILFVHHGPPEEVDAFFARQWPAARVVTDPDGALYRRFGIGQGRIDQLLSPGVVACSLRAVAKGNFVGRSGGDPRLMPGLFLVAGDAIRWQHDFRHAGDHPDFAALPARLAHELSAAQ